VSHDEVYKGNNEGGLYTPPCDAKTLKQMGQDQGSDVEEGGKEAASTIGPHPRKDEPTPGKAKEEPLICARCGGDITARGRIEKGGKFYCARPGCGYPPRDEAKAT
jgi:hypothetical protein